MPTFTVTYEIITPDSANIGEISDGGFYLQDVSLREAFDALGGSAESADLSPFSLRNPPRWFTAYAVSHDYDTGADESRSLHLPRNITPASAMRVARLLGVAR